MYQKLNTHTTEGRNFLDKFLTAQHEYRVTTKIDFSKIFTIAAAAVVAAANQV